MVAKRRGLYILFLERLRGDRLRKCLSDSELHFLGWGSEKNKIYNPDEIWRTAKTSKIIGGEIIFIEIKNKIKKIINKKEKNKIQGTFNSKDKISPSYISNINPKYLEIDNIYYSGLLVVNYNREINNLILKKLLDINLNMNISIFYEIQDNYKAIRDLTYHIANVAVDLKDGNQNRQDIDIAAFTYNDAKYIRKEIQINNEDIYFLYIYIELFSNNIKEQEYLLNKIEGIMQSSGMQTRRANFRQEQLYLSCMPFMDNNVDLKKTSGRNVLTTGLTATYPFISSAIFDEKGIFLGSNIYNNSLVFIDRYNTSKYKNANMCIFGTSGSRKIFFYKTTNIKI